MKNRQHKYRLVKIHRNYSVKDISLLFNVHKNTVRNWIKSGLPPIDDKRPILIQGFALAEFIKNRRQKNKRTCKPGQFYCMKCRAPKFPAEKMAEYEHVSEKIGNLVAICPECSSIMNQRVSSAKIGKICDVLDIMLPKELQQLVERRKPTVNSDFR